jgi:hypothetical protein
VELRSVVYHPYGLDYFTQHIQNEYSGENIQFWKACIGFRKFCNGETEGIGLDDESMTREEKDAR